MHTANRDGCVGGGPLSELMCAEAKQEEKSAHVPQ